ncbi:MAG TPA: TraB/GumN family protein, partial [Roseiarcus sp.]|nr:TraB/GumN family protein [Roseiarcus sp.]
MSAPGLAETPVCQGRDLSELAAAHQDALKAAENARRDWLVNAQGLLWRIDKPGVAPSYLYGTIHSSDDRAVALARDAAMHIRDAKVVATELGGPLDKSAMAEAGANLFVRAVAKDVDTFAPIASPDDRTAVEKLLAGRGISADLAHHIQLWFLAASIAEPPCEVQRQALDLPVVDNILAE